MAEKNEDVPGPRVTDEERHAEILSNLKYRKAGQPLFEFLERQVGDSMATVLNQPMHNIPENILSRVVSKSIQADLRKYKMGVKAERTTRERTRSPEKRLAERETRMMSPSVQNLSQGQRNRSNSASRGGYVPSGAEIAKYEHQLSELRRQVYEKDQDNETLRMEYHRMLEDYSEQLRLRDEQIEQMKDEKFRYADQYKQEAIVLRDQLNQMKRQMEMQQSAPSNDSYLRSEIDRLQSQAREMQMQMKQKDDQLQNQVNEYAGVYSNQRGDLEQLTLANSDLTTKIKQLEIDLDMADQRYQQAISAAPNFGGAKESSGEEGMAQANSKFAETEKRLKKRELETQALWDTIKDMKNQGMCDEKSMWELLAKRALDSKAERKLDMPKKDQALKSSTNY